MTYPVPDQSGRTFVVTGANSGIGFEAALKFAGAGGHVVLAVRDVARGEEAAGKIDGSTEVRELDLANLASVRKFAADYTAPIDVLVNNAGIMMVAEGRISLHPGGFAHGPQPSAIEASLGVEYFEESAVMVDTFAPLDLGEAGLAVDDPAYAWTWSEQ